MKYTIESTDNGCVEKLEFSDGSIFIKNSERTEFGCKSINSSFADQLRMAGFCEEIIEKVSDLYDSFSSLYFLDLMDLDN